MDELIRLCNANLEKIPADIPRPSYDRTALTPGIVHIGVGNFHRAHQAWYLHRLMQTGAAQDWAIIGAGVRDYDAQMRQKLRAQDYLTTLIELNPASTSAEIIGSMIDYLPIEAGNRPLIDQMSAPEIRIVSLTVTEGGYYIDPASKVFDTAHPDIVHDAAHPETPRTVFGTIVAALRNRRQAGYGPFTGLSCDNLQGNGDILRQAIVSLAELSNPELADWISTHCTFPNSMVDCIVPATGTKELALAHKFGLEDAAPVTHESFRQWVIEDKFCAGRPDWDQIGATFTDDVHAYEKMKIRLLNAGHQFLANAAEILNIGTIAEAIAHPLIGAFFRKAALEEISPHVEAVPGMTPAAYVDLISSRFSNPAIVDTTRRVAFDGSSRHTGFLVPTIREALAKGASVNGLALAEAAWARMCSGTREDGSQIEPNDPLWDELVQTAQLAKIDPRKWLEQRHYYGDLASQPEFLKPFEHWLNLIWSSGMAAALQEYCGDQVKQKEHSLRAIDT
jgi:mannitol 2-dehydrogenase